MGWITRQYPRPAETYDTVLYEARGNDSGSEIDSEHSRSNPFSIKHREFCPRPAHAEAVLEDIQKALT